MTNAYNVLLANPNRADLPTVSGGAWTVNKPLTYIRSRKRAKAARTQGSNKAGTWAYLAFPAAISASFAAIAHSMGDTGKWRLRSFPNTVNPAGAISLQFTGGVLDSRVTFSRGSSATYLDANGVLQTVSNNVPRFAYAGGKCTGLVVEEAATNVCLQSRTFGSASWTKTGVSASSTATGLDGVANPNSVITATGANGVLTQQVVIGAATRAVSVYVKRLTGTGTIQLSGDNFATSLTLTGLSTTQFTRYEVQISGASPIFGIKIVTSGDAVILDCFQVEEGLNATSVITTTTVSVTRARDSWSFNMAAYGITNAVGTMVGKLKNISQGSPTLGGQWIGPSAIASGQNFIGARVQSAGMSGEIWRANSASMNTAQTVVAAGASIAFCMAWDATSGKWCVNGGAVTTDSTVSLPTDPTTVNNDLPATGCGGYVLEMLRIFPTKLPDADMQSLCGTELEIVHSVDTGWMDAWHADYLAAWTAEQRAGMPGNAYKVLAVPMNSMYFRIDFDCEAQPYIEFARAFLGDAYQPQVNMSYNAGIGYVSRKETTEAFGGAESFSQKPDYRVTDFALGFLDQGDAMKLLNLQRQINISKEMFFCWDPTDTANGPLLSYFARLRTLNKITVPLVDTWALEVSAKELL